MEEVEKFGFLKQSLVDYPGEVCAVLFFPKCNFHCSYCFNQHLPEIVAEEGWSFESIETYLQEARTFLTAVCLTGGETTLYPNTLATLIERFRALGYKVKIDTNGSHPGVLQAIQKQVHYIAMDLKTSLDRYAQLTQAEEPSLADAIAASMQILLQREPHAYEFRTTLAREWIQEADLHDLGKRLHPSSHWYLQRCRTETPLTAAEQVAEEKWIQQAVSIAKTYSQHVCLRK
ncbi:MAG: anaerobic ribonucleoside-triphosphate reductase activating protein [Opitutales bacterium]|nr:anaerobic ribonucleoside-triphosphate reductase activating protein [Opitutales bacterium]